MAYVGNQPPERPARHPESPKPTRRVKRRIARATKRLRKAERRAAKHDKKTARAYKRVDRMRQRQASAARSCLPPQPPQASSCNSATKPSIGSRLKTWWRNLSMPGAFSIYVTFYLLVALCGSLVSSNYFVELQYQIQEDGNLYTGVFIYDPDQDVLLQARPLLIESTANPAGHTVLYVQDYNGSQLDPAYIPDSVSVLDASDYPHDAASDSLLTESTSEEYVIDSVGTNGRVDPQTIADYNERALDVWAAAAPAEDNAFFRNSSSLLISPIAYYLHEPPSTKARIAEGVTGTLSVLMFPLWFGLCIYMAGRRFYAQRIKPAVELFDAATVKIAEQVLDFAVVYDRTDELGRLAESFETMRSSLAQSQRVLWATAEERRHLNAAFAHDLRTPLTILHGRIELLQARASTGSIDPKQLSEACLTLSTQVERLERYVAAMSSIQRLEDRTITPTPLDLVAFFANINEAGTQLCRASSVAFLWENPSLPQGVTTVCADRSAIAEVVENLIGNAARYATSQVSAHIVVEGFSSSARITLVVEDDGPGFSPEALEQGLEPFFGESKMDGHFGLGLNISQLLCKKHGGSLELSNRSDASGARVVARFACTLL